MNQIPYPIDERLISQQQPLQQPIPMQQQGIVFEAPIINNIQKPQLINEETKHQVKEIIEYPPNKTLYINNLNERVRIEDLKDALREMFEEHGEIIEIIAKRNIKMRGQAFIIFTEIYSAHKARETLNGIELFGKQMRINFAKDKSDIIAKREGTYAPRQKNQVVNIKDQIERKIEEKKKTEQKEKISQQQKQQPKQTIVPHNILFVENLTPSITQDILVEYFQNYAGFKEVRLIPTKKVAFIEYEDEFKAGVAMSSLVGVKIMDCTLHITYAKR